MAPAQCPGCGILLRRDTQRGITYRRVLHGNRTVHVASAPGRLMRVVLGVVLIVVGIVIGGPAGWALGVIGLLPITAGAANVCVLGPLLRAPFRGSDLER